SALDSPFDHGRPAAGPDVRPPHRQAVDISGLPRGSVRQEFGIFELEANCAHDLAPQLSDEMLARGKIPQESLPPELLRQPHRHSAGAEPRLRLEEKALDRRGVLRSRLPDLQPAHNCTRKWKDEIVIRLVK